MINWQRIWNDDGIINRYSVIKIIATALSWPYSLIINFRNRLYDKKIIASVKLPCPVISIGNITIGGTGKTPCVIMLAQMLQSQGFKPAILSRGYGGVAKYPVNVVSDGNRVLMDHVAAGDEPVLLARSLPGIPVITGHKRAITGRYAIKHFQTDILIMDDGFQHRSLARDGDVILMDAGNPFGNGLILPAGPLREPLSSLVRAHLVVLTRMAGDGKDKKAAFRRDYPECLLLASRHKAVCLLKCGSQYPLEHLRGKRVYAFSGIGQPETFPSLLESLGGQVVASRAYDDHHAYSREDITIIHREAEAIGADIIVTTEKDGIKLEDFEDFFQRVFLLRIRMTFIPDDGELKKWLSSILQSH